MALGNIFARTNQCEATEWHRVSDDLWRLAWLVRSQVYVPVSWVQKTMRFGVVGVLTAVLHYGLLFVGVNWMLMNATLASSLGFIIAVIFNYLMHYNWTFGEPAPHGSTLRRYLVMISCGFFINAAFMYLGDEVLGVQYLLVQALAMAVVVLWNYVLSNTWVFRRRAP